MMQFDKKMIYHGLKKRFLKLPSGKYFCFYDGFGTEAGTTRDYLSPEDYKNASLCDVNSNIDDIIEDMKLYETKINNAL